MNESKKEFYRKQANSIINKMKARKMEGYYCDNIEEARAKFLELLGNSKKTISYGGSMTIDENGFKEAAVDAGHILIKREDYKTPEEQKEMKAKISTSDVFLMSSNAITLDGELINIDGAGSRVAYLIYGPDEVIIVAGMNKIVTDVESGIERVRNFASPPNTTRLNVDSPCAKTGQCGNCLENTICCQIVVTRASRIPGRIKVIFIGEELGY